MDSPYEDMSANAGLDEIDRLLADILAEHEGCRDCAAGVDHNGPRFSAPRRWYYGPGGRVFSDNRRNGSAAKR